MIAVLCPVLGRPHHAAPLAASLAEATENEYTLYFICSRADEEEIAACQATSASVMVVPWRPGRADFARKINWAFQRTTEPWLFQAGDDVRFRAGWDAEAFRVVQRSRASVIGTNDLGNALVMRGQASTHTLFSRAYIERFGGTVDKTGLVFCERYSHQYVDNEFVETAKMRRQFAFAQRSIVEHLHPHWGKAEMDEVYEKGLAETLPDRKLFQSRLSLIRRHGSRTRRQP